MRKRQRFTFLAIGAIGLAAAIGPGLAAGIAVPSTAPAAGQGAVDVEGFLVCEIDWTVSDADPAKVTAVEFTIERETDADRPATDCGDATSTVDSVADGTSLDAVVRVQLRTSTSPTGDAAWQGCVTTAGAAVCTLATGAQLPVSGSAGTALDSINIIAFDRN